MEQFNNFGFELPIGPDNIALQQANFVDLQEIIVRSKGLKDIQQKIIHRIQTVDELSKQGLQ
jgi:hypothetical protein